MKEKAGCCGAVQKSKRISGNFASINHPSDDCQIQVFSPYSF
ncbi:hypothetical protein [Aliikangiella coralliicola]|nr:hypothetical protein [Aliikangiella coralliicola]